MSNKIKKVLSAFWHKEYRLAVIGGGMWKQYEFKHRQDAMRLVAELGTKVRNRPDSWTLYKRGRFNLPEREIKSGNFQTIAH